MKKYNTITAVIIVLALLFCGCGRVNNTPGETTTEEQSVTQSQKKEPVKAVWINYNELSMKERGGGDGAEFSQKVSAMFSDIASLGANRVIVQVRPFSDALYFSSTYPASEYLSGQQGLKTSYDALTLMVAAAHEHGLLIDAWINPYRVSYKTDFSLLAESNPAKIWYNEDNNSSKLIVIDKGIFYNPASSEVQKLILDGVREILNNYDVDGIHIDDYFYPSTEESIDSNEYSQYINLGGTMDLASWRRENVSCFVSTLYTTIKGINPTATLTISPSGDIDKNFSQHFADIERWCSQSGYADIIMPQLYYGFENDNLPFEETAKRWAGIVTCADVSLCFGLAVYKCGNIDEYAGEGKEEWVNNSDIISRQLGCIKGLCDEYGWAFYSYSGLFSGNLSEIAKKELQNMKSML